MLSFTDLGVRICEANGSLNAQYNTSLALCLDIRGSSPIGLPQPKMLALLVLQQGVMIGI